MPQTIATSEWLFSVSFTDALTGTVVGYGIWRTTDGGLTWTPQNIPYIGFPLWSVSFIDSDNGYAVGGNPFNGTAGILRTTNGGSDWVLQPTPTPLPLHGVSFSDALTGTIVGMHGVILRTTNGGVTFVEENETNEIATEYYLSNNFPNPFNPTTKIRYSVPQSTNVVIKVYDILANEIETLVNEEKQIGTYEITWYAENLPSGVYFYRLQSGDFVETKKMVLMK